MSSAPMTFSRQGLWELCPLPSPAAREKKMGCGASRAVVAEGGLAASSDGGVARYPVCDRKEEEDQEDILEKTVPAAAAAAGAGASDASSEGEDSSAPAPRRKLPSRRMRLASQPPATPPSPPQQVAAEWVTLQAEAEPDVPLSAVALLEDGITQDPAGRRGLPSHDSVSSDGDLLSLLARQPACGAAARGLRRSSLRSLKASSALSTPRGSVASLCGVTLGLATTMRQGSDPDSPTTPADLARGSFFTARSAAAGGGAQGSFSTAKGSPKPLPSELAPRVDSLPSRGGGSPGVDGNVLPPPDSPVARMEELPPPRAVPQLRPRDVVVASVAVRRAQGLTRRGVLDRVDSFETGSNASCDSRVSRSSSRSSVHSHIDYLDKLRRQLTPSPCRAPDDADDAASCSSADSRSSTSRALRKRVNSRRGRRSSPRIVSLGHSGFIRSASPSHSLNGAESVVLFQLEKRHSAEGLRRPASALSALLTRPPTESTEGTGVTPR